MEQIAVGVIVIVAVIYTIRHLKSEVSGDGSCNCSSCPASKKNGCSSEDKEEK